MAAGAAAAAKVARIVIGARKREQWIEQASLLQSEKDGIGAQLGSEAARAQLYIRMSGVFVRAGNADLALFTAAALEDAQHIAGLGDLPSTQRIECRQDSFVFGFL